MASVGLYELSLVVNKAQFKDDVRHHTHTTGSRSYRHIREEKVGIGLRNNQL